jgi:uncharacterized protein
MHLYGADKMKRLIAAIAILALASVPAPDAVRSLVASPAFAQQRDGRPNLLDLLFGGGLLKQRRQTLQEVKPPSTRRVIVKRRASTPSRGASQPTPKEIVAKDDDANQILIIGDFLADGLHWGLEQAYSENSKVVFVNKSSGLSGLVRDDVVDWPARTPEFITAIKPVAVVVAVGMNDRQEMRLPDGRPDKLTDEWRMEYDRRVERIIDAVRQRDLPLIWLGLPPVRQDSMTSDYLIFNDIYRGKVELAGGSFVDVWDGFTNADGDYIAAGPDIRGQIVRLRNSDGINLTNAGKRKLAFYAEREIRKITGIGSDPETTALPGIASFTIFSDPAYDPSTSGRTIVLSLDDPEADGGTELEGEEGFLDDEGSFRATSYDLVARGQSAVPHEGRIDAGWGLPAIIVTPELPVAGAPAAGLVDAPATPQ